MKAACLALFFLSNLLNYSFVYAQKDSSSCKVIMQEIAGTYTGDCKNGLANGNGKSNGLHHYTGSFKKGMPDGAGIYYYSDSVYYDGSFQEGIKEGKGEMHYVKKGMPDSVITGYWSGGEYRGKKYSTYTFASTEQFDQMEITPSKASGNTVTIEIGTTSGSPNGTPGSGINYILTLSNINSPTGSILKTRSKYESAFKSYITLEMVGFPCKLFGTLSDDQTFSLDLYKAADWKIRFYKNK